MTRPATKKRASSPLKSFPLKKCLGHIVGITIVLVHAIDVKFGPPSEILFPLVSQAGYQSAGDCYLVTSASYATQLSLSKSKLSGLKSNFNTRN